MINLDITSRMVDVQTSFWSFKNMNKWETMLRLGRNIFEAEILKVFHGIIFISVLDWLSFCEADT